MSWIKFTAAIYSEMTEEHTNNLPDEMTILITGTAGFIGSALTLRLLDQGYHVVGIDNHNNYYDQKLKADRVSRFLEHPHYTHYRADLSNRRDLDDCFLKHQPHKVVNLAAQAGVRYSIDNPQAYIESNIVGFANILECCRQYKVKHLVYASSSSVYGANTSMPFSVHHNVDHPLSLYAATKKSNELMAHAYSHLYNIPTTGLRFFTVYGPWGRPDMAMFKFTKAILEGKPIQIFNHGKHRRDFTYIDDIVEGITRVLLRPAEPNETWNGNRPDAASSPAPWRIYNIGSNSPVNLIDYIHALEKLLGRKAIKNLVDLQPGDVTDTYADVDDLIREFDYKPSTSIENGMEKFVRWYLDYYGKY